LENGFFPGTGVNPGQQREVFRELRFDEVFDAGMVILSAWNIAKRGLWRCVSYCLKYPAALDPPGLSLKRVRVIYDVAVMVTAQGLEYWKIRRATLRRWFWVYLCIAAIGAFFFVRSFRAPDPYGFAMLLLIPLVSLRQAWKMDRQIVACDAQIRSALPTIGPEDKPS
jgi:hypothetical protein